MVQKAHRKVVQRRLKILLVFLIMAAIGTAVVYQFSQYHQYEGYQVSWEKSLTSQTEGQTDSSFCGYEAFGGGILLVYKRRHVFFGLPGKHHLEPKL